MTAHETDGTAQPDPTADLLPPVAQFVRTVRKYISEGHADIALWSRVARDLETLLADPALKERAKSWPDTKRGNDAPSNLLFYEDPNYGFVLNALVKTPGAVTSVHDHGQSWTLYGVLEGGEYIERFARTDDNPTFEGPAVLQPDGTFDVTPGYIDVVPPWQIHRETNGDHRTIGFIVRSQRSGTFRQCYYDRENGDVTEYRGPSQIPFALASAAFRGRIRTDQA